MGTYTSGCFICGKPLRYLDLDKTLKCELCGSLFQSNVTCENEHFVCDACHAQSSYGHITEEAQKTKSKNPTSIAVAMMKHPAVNAHGPEHHYLIVAALLSAYKNAGGAVCLDDALLKARQRAKAVPGGICGMWGCCGAGIGAGIFISIITETTPLSEEEWGLANLATSQSLFSISQNGGPRCCKRNTLLSISSALDFVGKYLTIKMEKPQTIVCPFFQNNPTCRKANCLYYPNRQ